MTISKNRPFILDYYLHNSSFIYPQGVGKEMRKKEKPPVLGRLDDRWMKN